MDVSTLFWVAVAAWLLIDIPTGGLIAANVLGGAAAGGGAAWREVAGSAKASYARRATELEKTAIGRWRLKAEAKVGRAGLKAQAAVAGLARGGARAVAEAAKAAPAGAAKGREVRQRALATAKEKAAAAVATARAKAAERTAKNEPEIVPGMVAGQDAVAATVVPFKCPRCGTLTTAQMVGSKTARVNCSCQPMPEDHEQMARAVAQERADMKTPPVLSGSETEDHMSDLENASEDRGVAPYMAAWDGETGMERIVGELSALADRMRSAVEKNRRHDPDGADDVVGKVQAAVEAARGAGEAIDNHKSKLHDKWDASIENLKATGADSAAELVGSQ